MADVAETSSHLAHHRTLKKHVPTRWNSVLSMIESLLALRKPVEECLKRIGHTNLIPSGLDWDILDEVRIFLKCFKELTDLVSGCNAGLSLIPLIKEDIKSALRPKEEDSDVLRELKNNIELRVDRFPMCDTVQLACLMDPSTKDSLSLSDDEKVSLINDEIIRINREKMPAASVVASASDSPEEE